MFAKVVRADAPPGQYTIDHSATLAVLDPQGRMAGIVRTPLDVPGVAADLQALTETLR